MIICLLWPDHSTSLIDVPGQRTLHPVHPSPPLEHIVVACLNAQHIPDRVRIIFTWSDGFNTDLQPVYTINRVEPIPPLPYKPCPNC